MSQKYFEDKNFKSIDKPFFFKLLNEICTISEQEDFVENEFITEQGINYVIEFDRQHKHLLKLYPQDKLFNYIEEAINLYRICVISNFYKNKI